MFRSLEGTSNERNEEQRMVTKTICKTTSDYDKRQHTVYFRSINLDDDIFEKIMCSLNKHFDAEQSGCLRRLQ